MIVTGPVLFRHTPDPDLKVKVTDLDVLFDDRYRSKVLCSNTRAHAYDCKVKVIDLQILIVNI